MVKKRRPHDELKPAFVDAAKSAIDQGGLSALSARRLADAVGVSVGTLYNLFGHLDGVVRAVNLDYLADLHADLSSALDAAGETTEERLLAMAEAYFDYACAAPHRWEALFHYRPETPPEGLIDAAEQGLFQLLRRAAGVETSDDILRALWAAVHGVVELAMGRHLSGTDDQSPRAHVRLIVMAGLRGVQLMQDEGLLKKA